MNRVNASLVIVPSNFNVSNFKNAPELFDIYNKQFSTLTEIKVNKYNDGYIVVYSDKDFKQLNPKSFVINLVSLFLKNIPNTVIDMTVKYIYTDNEFSNIEGYDNVELFDPEVAKMAINIDQLLDIMSGSGYTKLLSYHKLRSFVKMVSDYQEYIYMMDERDDGSEVDIDDDEDEDDTDDEFVPNISQSYDDEDDDVSNEITKLVSGITISKSNNKSSKSKNKKKGKRNVDYGTSKVLRHANSPKRAYNRHGVIIASDKDDIRSDEKIIKEFLKEFIPGNQEWKKEFRHDLLKRWISMYCVSKKDLKKLESNHRKKTRKRSYIDADKTLDFTRRLLNVPLDNWNNPNK